ncbi:MAG: YggS family pyridoxal phosphate-dependent enzyme [bacterium]
MSEPLQVPEGLRERLDQVRRRIQTCASRCGREAEAITLVAVSKTHPVEAVRKALGAGVTDFGENRVQEAESKIPELGHKVARWHLVGHLQANKASRALKLFDVIHSLDSVALARRLNRLCEEEERDEFPVLIQVDIAREESKSGVTEDGLPALLEAINECSRLRLAGLMTLPPYFADPELVRPFFTRLREMRDAFQVKGYFGQSRGELSMGMSHDFDVAIEEGATILRIGTAIFGKRNPGVEE